MAEVRAQGPGKSSMLAKLEFWRRGTREKPRRVFNGPKSALHVVVIPPTAWSELDVSVRVAYLFGIANMFDNVKTLKVQIQLTDEHGCMHRESIKTHTLDPDVPHGQFILMMGRDELACIAAHQTPGYKGIRVVLGLHGEQGVHLAAACFDVAFPPERPPLVTQAQSSTSNTSLGR